MKCLLVSIALLSSVFAAAQTPTHLYAHPRLYTLRPSAHFYQSPSDTVTALATQLATSQVVTARASNDYQWAFVSNLLGSSPTSQWKLISPAGGPFTEWYVRRTDLILVPDKKPSSAKHRRK